MAITCSQLEGKSHQWRDLCSIHGYIPSIQNGA